MQTVLITGVSEGIGAALAIHYAAQGARVLGVSRRPWPERLAGSLAAEDYARIDLGEPDAPTAMQAFLQRRQVHTLDVLIHNAAAGWYGAPAQQDSASIDYLLQVNLYAPIGLTHVLLPRLRVARGVIVFISSVHSALPTPDFALYTATKAGIDGFARGLRIEEHGKVDVLVVWPGPTRTQMHAKSGVPPERLRNRRYASPEAVAVAIATAIQRRRSCAVGIGNELLRWMALHLEAPLQAMMVAWVRRRSSGKAEGE